MLIEGLTLKKELTAARLRELLHYDPETGFYTWIQDHGRHRAGERAERKAAKDYRGITIDGSPYLCHRLAWFLIQGEWPTHDVDHKNGLRSDNRRSNLRHGSRAFNMQNLQGPHVDSASQLLGAYQDKRRGTWMAKICKNGKTTHLGTFKTPEQAHAAYIFAKRELHEACTI